MRKSTIREKEIERHLVREIEKLGGKCRKWRSPQNNGVLDRIVQMPGGRIWFVELKAPNGDLSPQQELEIRWLTNNGFRAVVLASKKEVNAWVEDIL
jgi:hypothetical protein